MSSFENLEVQFEKVFNTILQASDCVSWEKC